jgi:hypothetical protein
MLQGATFLLVERSVGSFSVLIVLWIPAEAVVVIQSTEVRVKFYMEASQVTWP